MIDVFLKGGGMNPMNKSSTANYIVYVNYRSTSAETGYSCSTVKPDSLSNIMKGNIIIVNETIQTNKLIPENNLQTPDTDT